MEVTLENLTTPLYHGELGVASGKSRFVSCLTHVLYAAG